MSAISPLGVASSGLAVLSEAPYEPHRGDKGGHACFLISVLRARALASARLAQAITCGEGCQRTRNVHVRLSAGIAIRLLVLDIDLRT